MQLFKNWYEDPNIWEGPYEAMQRSVNYTDLFSLFAEVLYEWVGDWNKSGWGHSSLKKTRNF